jgi:hypothetical protein
MLKTSIITQENGREVCTHEGYKDGRFLIAQTYASVNGCFKAATRAAAGTTIITEPDLHGSIVLTDLIVTSDRVNAAIITLRFTDGTNTINIFVADVTDAPCNVATSFVGQWKGWKDARLEVVTVGVVKATVAVGYFKLPEETTLGFVEWDTAR